VPVASFGDGVSWLLGLQKGLNWNWETFPTSRIARNWIEQGIYHAYTA